MRDSDGRVMSELIVCERSDEGIYVKIVLRVLSGSASSSNYDSHSTTISRIQGSWK